MGLGQLFNIIAGPISFNSGGPVRHSKKKIQPINPQPRGGGQHKGNGAVSAQPRQAAVQQQRHVLPAVPGQGGAVRGGRRDGQGVADAEEAELQPGGGGHWTAKEGGWDGQGEGGDDGRTNPGEEGEARRWKDLGWLG